MIEDKKKSWKKVGLSNSQRISRRPPPLPKKKPHRHPKWESFLKNRENIAKIILKYSRDKTLRLTIDLR